MNEDPRPYAESLAAWLASESQDQAPLLQGEALQDAWAWLAKRSLGEAEYQFLMASQTQEKEANRLQSQFTKFLGGLSHELSSPMSALISCIRIVLDDFCDSRAEEKDYLERAVMSAFQLKIMLDTALDMARIAARTQPMVTEPTALAPMLQEVVTPFAVRALAPQLILSLPEHLSSTLRVQADPLVLKQVLTILLNSAIKFTYLSSAMLTIQTEADQVVIALQAARFDSAPTTCLPAAAKDWWEQAEYEVAIARRAIELMGGSLAFYRVDQNLAPVVELRLPFSSH